MHDLTPATSELARVVAGIRDDQLGLATPDGDRVVADMLDHVDGLSLAFAAAAAKTGLETSAPPVVDGTRIGKAWRTRIPERLRLLAKAWQERDAWTGMTKAGGVDLPGSVAALVAANEVVVHGWDLAVATGQRYECPPEPIEAALEYVAPAVARHPAGTPGLFGAPVPVADDAPPLDRLLGLTGRDPAWQPGDLRWPASSVSGTTARDRPGRCGPRWRPRGRTSC
jgi:uncharacterized protein (TIGR03086 family)